MGGSGSGRSWGFNTRPCVERHASLDISLLWRGGALREGPVANGTIDLISHAAAQSITLAWTPCNYGGERPWFCCPGCGRRARKLYWARGFFCRRCLGLVYVSQRQNPISRSVGRESDIYERLGEKWAHGKPFPRKPRYMHWKTYFRLHDRVMEAQRKRYGFTVGLLQRLEARLAGR